jgi:formate hydrogenlyase subunit 4
LLTAVTAGLMIPMVSAEAPLGLFGGALAVVYLLGLGRFLTALAGLDTGSSFGGLGSSREMTISSLAEPAMMLAIFTVAIGANSTSLSEIARVAIGQQWRFLAPSLTLAFAALFLVLIAETGRIPVDNPATHLELTMIHEAMILEYSGPYLAFIEWGGAVKQLLLMTLLINCFWPIGLQTSWSIPNVLISLGYLLLKLMALSCAVVLVETTNAKMRLFRVPEMLAVAFTLGALALVSTFLF